MTTDTALFKKREELKRRLAAGEYKTLVDVLFDWMSKVIQKISRSPHLISPWINGTILFLLISLLVYTALFLMGDIPTLMMQIAAFPQGTFALVILLFYATSLLMVTGNMFVHRTFTIFCESVLDATETVATLNDFTNWLTGVCNRKLHFIVSLVGGMLGIYVAYVYKITFRQSFPISADIGLILLNIILFVFVYLFLYMIVLSARFGQYHLKLHTADPGNSEVISRLARLFSNLAYLAAIYAAFFVFVIVFSSGLLIQLILVLIFSLWIPLTLMFVLYQSSLSSIIRRSKWKTLNEIQAKIEKMHALEKLGEKETMETINRLMDYYDRIKSTRNSRIDLEAVLHLINSLLLPLLALVLGNIDKILALLPQRP
jgi:hypothetical protein